MKSFRFLASLAMLLAFAFTACDSSECGDTDCNAQGSCVDGECVCFPGYEGAECDELTAPKLVGAYDVSGNCGSYQVDISLDPDDDAYVFIQNFSRLQCAGSGDIVVQAQVSQDTVKVVPGIYCTQGVQYIFTSGQGFRTGDQIDISYTYKYYSSQANDTVEVSCNELMTKQ